MFDVIFSRYPYLASCVWISATHPRAQEGLWSADNILQQSIFELLHFKVWELQTVWFDYLLSRLAKFSGFFISFFLSLLLLLGLPQQCRLGWCSFQCSDCLKRQIDWTAAMLFHVIRLLFMIAGMEKFGLA